MLDFTPPPVLCHFSSLEEFEVVKEEISASSKWFGM